MKISIISVLIGVLFISGCGVKPNSTESPTPIEKEFPEFFQKVLNAHGGWETWNKMNTLKFSGVRPDQPTQYIVDLKSRKEIIEREGNFRIGSTETDTWITPNREAFSGKSIRFLKNLTFYFVAVPFVFGDDGVILEDLEIQQVDSLDYQVIKVTFENGIGDAPEDQYKMYVNPNTSKVDFLTYSVTYFNKENATKFNALKYDWKDVNGLLFPEKYVGYVWQDSTFGKERYQSPFKNADYSEEKVDPAIFEIPEGAFVEK